MVDTKKLTEQEKDEVSKLESDIKIAQDKIRTILKDVQQTNILPNFVDEGRYDILIDEMVPPEALHWDKMTDTQRTCAIRNDKEHWCLVHNRMESNPCGDPNDIGA